MGILSASVASSIACIHAILCKSEISGMTHIAESSKESPSTTILRFVITTATDRPRFHGWTVGGGSPSVENRKEEGQASLRLPEVGEGAKGGSASQANAAKFSELRFPASIPRPALFRASYLLAGARAEAAKAGGNCQIGGTFFELQLCDACPRRRAHEECTKGARRKRRVFPKLARITP
jgi:hypothetical protein